MLAALSLAGGGVALMWPDITALVLVIWAVITGAIEILLAFRQGENTGERSPVELRG